MKIPEECDQKNNYILKFFYVLSKRYGKDLEWGPFISNCLKKEDRHFLTLVNLKKEHLKNWNTLKKFLKENEVAPKNQLEVLKVYQHFMKRSDSFAVKYINEIPLRLKNKDITKLISLYEKMARNSLPNFLRSLIKAYFAVSVNNRGWEKKEVFKILNMSPMEIKFELGKLKYKSEESRLKTEEKIKTIVKIIIENIQYPNLSGFLGEFFKRVLGHEELVPKSWNGSLFEIRKKMNSYYLGTNLVGFWFLVIYKRIFDSETFFFLNKKLTSEFLKERSDQYFWLFSYFWPNDETRRNQILPHFKKLVKKKGPYNKFLLVHLLRNKVLKKTVSDHFPVAKKPRFQFERKVFRDFLSNGMLPELSIFNLLKLGDLDESYFWWFLINEDMVED